jgi:hypothetical protein
MLHYIKTLVFASGHTHYSATISPQGHLLYYVNTLILTLETHSSLISSRLLPKQVISKGLPYRHILKLHYDTTLKVEYFFL